MNLPLAAKALLSFSQAVCLAVGLSVSSAPPSPPAVSALTLQLLSSALLLLRCWLGIDTRARFQWFLRALLLDGLANTLGLALLFSHPNPSDSLPLWAAVYVGGAVWVVGVTLTVAFFCAVRRPFLRRFMETLVDRGFVPPAPGHAEVGVASCPATVFLLPPWPLGRQSESIILALASELALTKR